MDSSTERGRLRVSQIEQRILAKHPKAARDGELASMLSDLDDILGNEIMDKPDLSAKRSYDPSDPAPLADLTEPELDAFLKAME